MPQIIPIRDLKNTSEISKICHETNEPVFITKNGYGDMVIMSMETYKKTMVMEHVYYKPEQAEESIKKDEFMDAFDSIKSIRQENEL